MMEPFLVKRQAFSLQFYNIPEQLIFETHLGGLVSGVSVEFST